MITRGYEFIWNVFMGCNKVGSIPIMSYEDGINCIRMLDCDAWNDFYVKIFYCVDYLCLMVFDFFYESFFKKKFMKNS